MAWSYLILCFLSAMVAGVSSVRRDLLFSVLFVFFFISRLTSSGESGLILTRACFVGVDAAGLGLVVSRRLLRLLDFEISAVVSFFRLTRSGLIFGDAGGRISSGLVSSDFERGLRVNLGLVRLDVSVKLGLWFLMVSFVSDCLRIRRVSGDVGGSAGAMEKAELGSSAGIWSGPGGGGLGWGRRSASRVSSG